MKGKTILLVSHVSFVLIVSSSAFRYSVSKIQDMNVYNENGILQCDQIECPEGTTRCHVIKRNTKENASKLRRENTCYDENDDILKEKSWNEEYDGKQVDIEIDMSASGGSSVISQQHHSYSEDGFFGGISRGIGSIFKNVGSFISSFGILQCDQIECPEGTTRCHVIKRNTKENASKLRRENTCYDENDDILKEKSWNEEYDGKQVDIEIDMSASGGSSVISQQHHSYSEDGFFGGISRGIGSIFKNVGSFISSFGNFF